MVKNSNAVWIGAIVIVAVLTTVELISSRDENNVAQSIDSNTLANSAATSKSSQEDAGPIAMGSTEIIKTEQYSSAMTDKLEPDPYNTESELAPDLIVDLDDQEAEIKAKTKTPLDTTEKNVEEIEETKNHQNDPTNTNAAAEVTEMPEVTEATLTKVEIDGVTPDQPFEDEYADTSPLIAEAEEKPLTQPDEQLSIEQHLSAAEHALQELRMTTPAGDNAYEHYQAVLTVEPDNSEAQAGIQKIVNMYIYFVEKAIVDDQLAEARMYLQRAENIRPDSPNLKNLRDQIE